MGENTSGIRELKEDTAALKDGKISKFYASSQGETHLADSDSGKIQDMTIYGRSSQFTTTGKNLANGQNVNLYINGSVNVCGYANNDTGMAIDVSKLTNVTISTKSIQDRYRAACVNTVPQSGNPVTCYNGKNKDGTKDSYTIDTTGYNYLIINATKLEDIQVEEGSEATSYEPYTGGQSSPSPNYPQEIKSVMNPTVKVSNEDGTKSQTVTLPYTLNAIPVSSGGNVTIAGQQYIADYVDVEKGKLYRKVKRLDLKDIDNTAILHGFHSNGNGYLSITVENAVKNGQCISNKYKFATWTQNSRYLYIPNNRTVIIVDDRFTDKQTAIGLTQDVCLIYELASPIEDGLSPEQIKSLKSLSTYHPVTNITVGSEELDGYAVFNYPVSMTNGWNYVKQQLNDNRDYIYNMDTQSAEAYVNSEYAVALTELEV